MMRCEFEELAGYRVNFDDYVNIIEPMYMATTLSKEEFVKCLDKKRFALPTKKEMIKKMKKEASHLYEICGRYRDYESEAELDILCHEYLKLFYGIDWNKDIKSYAYTISEYEYPEIKRGCTYPKIAVFGRDNQEFERIELI